MDWRVRADGIHGSVDDIQDNPLVLIKVKKKYDLKDYQRLQV